jgi:cobalt-zinc-cadmium efflux system membrane fusion protein
VQVVVQTKSQVAGVPVPAAALMRNPSNQSIVWVKVAPERFEPRVLTTEPLDGANVVATTGLKAGERFVHQGASLVNQIR